MITYHSFKSYIESAETIENRLLLIEQAIDALILKLLDTTGTADLKEYQLDDGQTKIKVAYANVVEVEMSLRGLERVKQMYINKLSGRVFRLIDGSNFI